MTGAIEVAGACSNQVDSDPGDADASVGMKADAGRHADAEVEAAGGRDASPPLCDARGVYDPVTDDCLEPSGATALCRTRAGESALGGAETCVRGCLCDRCTQAFFHCMGDNGCLQIILCAEQTGCVDPLECYSPDTCQEVVDSNGGPFQQSAQLAVEISVCLQSSSCSADCSADGG